MNKDIRWKQRYQNFNKAMNNLLEAVITAKQRELSKLEKQGVIQAFEYTYELAWKTVKDFYESQGEVDIQGSRDAFQLAFRRGLVVDHGEELMASIKSRQLTSHTYDDSTANAIFHDIINLYFDAFKELADNLGEYA